MILRFVRMARYPFFFSSTSRRSILLPYTFDNLSICGGLYSLTSRFHVKAVRNGIS